MIQWYVGAYKEPTMSPHGAYKEPKKNYTRSDFMVDLITLIFSYAASYISLYKQVYAQ